MKQYLYAAALTACMSFGMFEASHATTVPVTVDGTTWQLTTVTGSFDDLYDQLTSQVWFGDENVALSFAEALGSTWSTVNTVVFDAGPLFVYSDVYFGIHGDSVDACGYIADLHFHACGTTTLLDEFVWAVTDDMPAVPLPASGLLLAGALGGFALKRRRKL